ncbi:protein tesmin/TSO1-like CXC 5 [Quillaja saponaria]|uniref:Protein tesmin/TSO1-like CXC 5 n=1 Tax=Quillaja saponaria TaxID=32244 RepID=A0AAD7LRW5_QUISA|nr:protein tesmin/TSO1-like CXC 5 [Quillaja saponaria]
MNLEIRAAKQHKCCRCKFSKCLKLYCECFASRLYCDGCGCTNCYNNIENEDARQEAAECILERNPYAFTRKISSSALKCHDSWDEEEKTPVDGKHHKGCHCKRTLCIKRYCECFRANILCSEICKCVDCKNYEECKEEPIDCKEQYNTKTIIQNSSCPKSGEIKSLSSDLSQAFRKNKHLSPLVLNEKDQSIRKLPQYQQLNPLEASSLESSICAALVGEVSSVQLGSLRFTNRSSLVDPIHPQDMNDICSALVVLSEAARIHTEKNDMRANQNVNSTASPNRENCPEVPNFQKVTDNYLSENAADAIERDDLKVVASQDWILDHNYITNAYEEQERIVLMNILNHLKMMIFSGNVKAGAGIENDYRHACTGLKKQELKEQEEAFPLIS